MMISRSSAGCGGSVVVILASRDATRGQDLVLTVAGGVDSAEGVVFSVDGLE